MCNCIAELEAKFKDNYPDVTSITTQHEILSGKSYMPVELEIQGKKKPKTVNVIFSHCPMCGERYDA